MRGLWIGWWLMVVACWGAELEPANLRVRGELLTLNPAPLWDGQELWLPLMHLETVAGIKLDPSTSPDPSEGAELPVPIELKAWEPLEHHTVALPCVPLRALVRVMGGYTRWDDASQTLMMLADLKAVRLSPEEDGVSVQTSLPVLWKSFTLNDPPRVVIDLIGCRLPDSPPTPEGTHPRVKAIRIGQFDPQTTRIVLETDTPLTLRQEGVAVAWTLTLRDQPVIAEAPTTPPAHEEFQLPPLERTVDGVRLRVPVPEGVRPRPMFLENPLRIVLDVPGVLSQTVEQAVENDELLVRALRAIPLEGGLVRLVLELSRAVGANLHLGKGHLTVNLRLPRGAGGTLRQKIVVIDPGHGGNQAGARFREGKRTVYEKDITLAIGLKVAERLAKQGASVIMTRAEDVSVGLYERTAIANQAGAHFFISIHCDSNMRPNSVSGTTIYYHRNDADSRALGQAILNEIVKVSGLPSKGVRSDTTLYQSGLAVLRTSQMPAVLIEVGFLNHWYDRKKLIDPKFQEAVADAIVRGLKAYVEGTTE
ncbi:MAG: N-acetylmuramoyl-L-alanine amidase [Armatimonadota bacterium]